MVKTCPVCKCSHNKRGIRCSRECYHSIPKSNETRSKMSLAGKGKPKSKEHCESIRLGTTGKPKPWQQGANNVNFQNKIQGTPEVHERFLRAVKLRGQPWTAEHRRQHSERMLGTSNAMRGTKHTPESIKAMSEAKLKQYREGTVRITRNKLSKAERNIAKVLRMNGVQFKTQFHIPGVPYLYDFFFPDLMLIIEYQGNYWHANPEQYPPGTLLPIQTKGLVRVEDIWDRDLKKRMAAIRAGYKLTYVWESDYNLRGMAIVYEILKTERAQPSLATPS